MEDGAIGHGAREVGAETTFGQQGELQRGDEARVVIAHGVVVGEGVALAGDHEVVVAVQAQLDGAAGLARGQGGPHGQVAGLRFLAAETAAHAPALHAHAVVVQPQGMGHPVLDLARMLGAAVDQPLLLFLRDGVGDLTFEIEVFLAAHLEAATQGVLGALHGLLGFATLHGDGR